MLGDQRAAEDLTVPFDDPEKEYRARFGTLGSPTPDQSVPTSPEKVRAELATNVGTTQTEPTIEELVQAFRQASLGAPTGTRIIVSSPLSRKTHLPDVQFTSPEQVCAWNFMPVEQGVGDADYQICLDFCDTPLIDPSPRMVKSTLDCRVYYNPGSDHCLFVSYTYADIYVTQLTLPTEPQGGRMRLSYSQSCRISDGVWRISVAREREQHLAEFLLRPRQFAISSPRKIVKGAIAAAPPYANRNDVYEPKKLPGFVPPTAIGKFSSNLGHVGQNDLSALQLSGGDRLAVQDLKHHGVSYTLDCRQIIFKTPGSTVFACEHSGLNELSDNVVAKVLNYTKGNQSLQVCVEHWKQEVKVLKSLHHRSIVRILSYDARLLILYLERLPPSLQTHLSAPLSLEDAFAVIVDISAVLMYQEGKKILHNDLKPSNIAYSRQRGATLLDYGLAGRQTMGGTPAFLPPEYLVGTKHHDRRGPPGEIWALGVTMLLCLGKITLFRKSEQVSALSKLADKKSADFRKLVNWHDAIGKTREKSLDKDNRLQRIVYDMLEPRPAKRITAAQIIGKLSTLKQLTGVERSA